MKPKLKLFIWTNVFTDYTSGMAFVIATDEADAREQLARAWRGDCNRGNLTTMAYARQTIADRLSEGTLEVRPLTKKCARFVCGGG